MIAFQRLCELFRDNNIALKKNEPMKNHTSFKIGGPAAVFCEPNTQEQLKYVLHASHSLGVKTFVLGNGTNVLFEDGGYNGVVVRPSGALCKISVDGETVTAGCGAKLADVCAAARDAGLSGLEFAYGIPGGVGGAVFMNAGAYGGEMRDVLARVACFDEERNVKTLEPGEMALGYRQSIFQQNGWTVLNATFRLQKDDPAEITRVMDENLDSRNEKQPMDMPSAGSAFKRPAGAYAGALIDQCGLRGFRVGDAAISEKHCGFIVNLGSATCADVLKLADEVAAKVKAQTGFSLEKEIRVVEG